MTFQNGFPIQTDERIGTLNLPTEMNTPTNKKQQKMGRTGFSFTKSEQNIPAKTATLGLSEKTINISQTMLSFQNDKQTGNKNLMQSRSFRIHLKPPPTAAESAKTIAIKKHLEAKRQSQVQTQQQIVTQKIGPGSYSNPKNLNLIGKHKPSNSVKGYGNGFLSKAERGLQKTFPVQIQESTYRARTRNSHQASRNPVSLLPATSLPTQAILP